MKLWCSSTLLLLFTVFSNISQIVTVNKLLKAFYHKSPGCDKIVFYFAQVPMVESISNSSFFIPCQLANKKSVNMVRKLRIVSQPWYELKTEVLTGKQCGLKLTVKKKSEHTEYDYAFFKAIGMQNGIVLKISVKKDRGSSRKRSKPGPVVVIDYGHGGSDSGAVGINGIREKDITRAVGQELAKLLRDRGINVKLTRHGDQTVALDKRTTKASYLPKVDMFVSLHGNSGPSQAASGIETYCSHPRLFYSRKKSSIGFCNAASCKVASVVHKHIMRRVNLHDDKAIVDRKIKQAVSQILLGTQAPAILVELGFVTNEAESLRLQDKLYQRLLARGIADGIIAYVTKVGLI